MFSARFSWARRLAVPLLLLSLGACGAQQPPIDIAAISAVQSEIKKQLLVYMRAAEKSPILVKLDGQNGPETDLRSLTSEQRRQYFWCGDGTIDYDITSVKAELQTSLVQNVGGSFGFTVPVPIAPSGTITFSRQATNSQTLDYTLYAIPYKMQPDLQNVTAPTDDELRGAPIAQVLLNLRYAQIGAALKIDPLSGAARGSPEACLTNFSLAKPSDDPKNSYVLALSIVVGANGSVSVGVAAAKIGVSGGSTTTTGHTLTVSFAQRDVDTMQAIRDVVDKKCGAPNGFSDDCKKAQKAYVEVIQNAMNGTPVSPESLRILGLANMSAGGGGQLAGGGTGILKNGNGFGVMMKRFDTPLLR